jgi:SSS family solute:Na+ symporter
LSLVSLAAYVLTKVSVTVYAGALVFSTLLPDTFGSPQNAFWFGAVLTVVVTGLYMIAGGLRIVLYTDTAQALILILGSARPGCWRSSPHCIYISRSGSAELA